MGFDIKRHARHLSMVPWQCRRAFSQETLTAIEREVKAGETAHTGEVRFVVEGALPGMLLLLGQSARERAIDIFSQLRMWDTEHRNAVLIYLLLADRSVEIVVDRGMHAKAEAAQWERICADMEEAFRAGRYRQGAVNGVRAVNELLVRHFPFSGINRNELSDTVLMI